MRRIIQFTMVFLVFLGSASAVSPAGLFASKTALLAILDSVSGVTRYNPGKEFRTASGDGYQVVIQKNGRVIINWGRGTPAFSGIIPMIWFDGDKAPKPLSISGFYSSREDVNDRLGQGNGFLVKKDDCEWIIRTYVTQPFFTAQVVYVNTGRKPVRIKALMPWCVEEGKAAGVSLGQGTEQAVILADKFGEVPELLTPRAAARNTHWLAAYNPQSGASIVTGFLTHGKSYGEIRMERVGTREDLFDAFRATCVYDPPVEVAPGERLMSEVLYVAVTEKTPQEGLERFGHAVAVINEVRRTKPPAPHGIELTGPNVNEAKAIEGLDFLAQNLKRYGWTTITIGDGWQRAAGDGQPDQAKFPHGIKWLADQAHERGLKLGLWISPNAVMPKDWGVDSIVNGGPSAALSVGGGLAQIEKYVGGLHAIREGFGKDHFISGDGPFPVSGGIMDGIRFGTDTAPIWQGQAGTGPWGCVETVTAAARRYHYAPYTYVADPGRIYLGVNAAGLTRDQGRLWLTAAALMGGVLTLGDDPAGLGSADLEMLRKVLPLSEKPTRPIDLFESPTPRIWSLPVTSPQAPAEVGNLQLVALFNWDTSAAQTITLDFARLGLAPDKYYTVYGFWESTYYGLAQKQLRVAVPPGSVKLLGLRPYAARPMFLATDNHMLQGIADMTALTWDESAKQLHGTFSAVENTNYALKILVPDPYKVTGTSLSPGTPKVSQDGPVLTILFRSDATGPANWSVQF